MNRPLSSLGTQPDWREWLAMLSPVNRLHLVHLLAINAVVASSYFGLQAQLLVYPALAAWALRGPRESIQALSLLWIPALVSGAIFPVPDTLVPAGPGYYTALRWLVLIAALASVGLRVFLRNEPLPGILGLLALFIVAAVPGSLAASISPALSLMKLMSFAIGVTAIVLAFRLSRPQHWLLGIWFFDLALVIAAWNIAYLPFDIGYRVHDDLYRGLFNHPQVTAMVIALIMVWLAGNALMRKSPEWQSWIIAAGCAVVLYQTGSRTGAYSVALGLAIVVALAYAGHMRWQAQLQAAMRRSGGAGLALAVAAMLATVSPAGIDMIRDFVVKRDPGPLGQTVQTTRLHKIERQWENFAASPVFGNGFGVPAGQRRHYSASSFQGVALSAPTEKNFMPTAVLEEVGAIGAAVLALLIAALAWPFMRDGSVAAAWLGLTFLASNLGEIAFFSFGGVGLFLWLMFAMARSDIPPRDIELLLPDPLDRGRRGY